MVMELKVREIMTSEETKSTSKNFKREIKAGQLMLKHLTTWLLCGKFMVNMWLKPSEG